MAWWNLRRAKPRRVDRLRSEGDVAWWEHLKSRQALTQVGGLAAFFAAALLLTERPEQPLPYRPGEVTRYPILSRVSFTYVDEKVTANARELASLRVRSVYRFDARPILLVRDALLVLVDAVAAAENEGQLAEPVRREWPQLASLAFEPLKKALGADRANLDAVKTALRESLDALAVPAALPFMRAQDYDHEVAEIERGNEAAEKLPVGLDSVLLQRPARTITVVSQAKETEIKLDDVFIKPRTVHVQIADHLRKTLDPLLGAKGVERLGAVLAGKVGPTLVQTEAERAETENRRAAARRLIQPIRIQVQADSTLVPAGTPLTDEHLRRLQDETLAFRESLGWPEAAGEWIGAGVLVALVTIIPAVYTLRFEPPVARSPARSLVLMALVLLVLGASMAVGSSPWSPALRAFFLVTAALIITTAYTERFAMVLAGAMVLLVAVAARSGFDWVLTVLSGASVGILALGEINNRSKLIKVGALAGLAMALATVGFLLWRLEFGAAWYGPPAAAALAYFGSGLAAGLVMLGLLPFIERAFGIVTNISLLELCDVNQPALKRLAIEAPGTYTHSLLIGTLAEAAAEVIGANGLLARVGAYFHDIGKVNKPRYYAENWQEEPDAAAPSSDAASPGSARTHEKLTPQMSRLVITSHVKDGLEMADRLGLPPLIKRFISEHHGTTLVEYFYREAERQHAESGAAAPAEEDYRYPGPIPQSPETAIVMLADAVESAARSLKEPTPAKLKATVHEMIMRRLLDGQLDSSRLTLSDLHKIEGTLTKGLLSVYHGRVPYPSQGAAAEPADAGGDREAAASDGRRPPAEDQGGPPPAARNPGPGGNA